KTTAQKIRQPMTKKRSGLFTISLVVAWKNRRPLAGSKWPPNEPFPQSNRVPPPRSHPRAPNRGNNPGPRPPPPAPPFPDQPATGPHIDSNCWGRVNLSAWGHPRFPQRPHRLRTLELRVEPPRWLAVRGYFQTSRPKVNRGFVEFFTKFRSRSSAGQPQPVAGWDGGATGLFLGSPSPKDPNGRIGQPEKLGYPQLFIVANSLDNRYHVAGAARDRDKTSLPFNMFPRTVALFLRDLSCAVNPFAVRNSVLNPRATRY